jgi:predicted ester cyclase
MSVESTQNVMMRYFSAGAGDLSMLAEDVVFAVMGTGQTATGRAAVGAMLTDLYEVAFDADFAGRVRLIGDGHAMIEGDFVGKHIGEFAGIPATGKSVRVPLCVVYDVEGDFLKRANVYFETSVLLRQLTAA